MQSFVSRVGGFFLAVAAAAGVARADEPVTLKYKWNKGETITYRMTTDTKTKMSGIPGMGDIDMTQKQVMISSMNVKDVAADGVATVVLSFDTIQVTMEHPMMGKMSYDSDKKDDNAKGNPLASSFGAMIGETMTFVIEPTGAVRSAEGMNRIIKKVIDAVEKENPGAGAIMEQQLQGAFGDEAMRKTYEQALKILPDKPVKTGDTWTTSMDMPMPGMGTLKSNITSTYQGTDKADGRSVAKIANTVVINLDPAAVNNPDAKIELKDGKGDGVNLFDIERGQLHKGTANATIPMTIIAKGPNGDPMTMTQAVTSVTLIERIESRPKPAEKPAEKPADHK